MRFFVKFILWIGRSRWIVDDGLAPGFELFGVPVVYYKWNDSFIILKDDGDKYRIANKRELNICTSDVESDTEWINSNTSPFLRWLGRICKKESRNDL